MKTCRHITFVLLILAISSVYLCGQTVSPSPSPISSLREVHRLGEWANLWLNNPGGAVPTGSGLRDLLNVICAALIGTAGAIAFFAGVKFGFIDRDLRSRTMEFLISPPRTRFLDRQVFYFLGGIVAAIFQWAQPDTLAPIQAFVLGATWPSVVTRIMSGSSKDGSAVNKLIETPPTDIKTPAGKSVEDVLVKL
jgi:hypothetical protein